MSKFKVGDEFEVLNNNALVCGVGAGDYVFLVGFESDGCHKFRSKNNSKIAYFFEESVKKIEVSSSETSKFKTSNRYKLHKYILSTGFSKLDLSRALNKGDSFLSVETRESQFTNRGDMSDARYKSLRKQIKETVDKIKSLHDSPVENPLASNEIDKTLVEVELKAKEYLHYDSNIGLTGGYSGSDKVIYNGEIVPAIFAVAKDMEEKKLNEKVKEAKQVLDTFHCKPKPSNNGVLILALVFFVMLVIFILGCFIYKSV